MDKATFYREIRKSFGSLSQSQVDGFEVVLRFWEELGDGDDLKFAYILATCWHETGRTMQPVAEIGRGRGHDYGIPDQTGKAPYGRGYVQLTFRANYVNAANKLGIPALASDYDKAMDPAVAAPVLVRGMMEGWFTGKKLADYVSGGHANYVGARRIVNGTDRASTIANYADQFEAALADAAKVAPAAPIPPITAAPTVDPVHASAPAPAAPSLPPLVQAVPAPPAGPGKAAPKVLTPGNIWFAKLAALTGLASGAIIIGQDWIVRAFHHLTHLFGG